LIHLTIAQEKSNRIPKYQFPLLIPNSRDLGMYAFGIFLGQGPLVPHLLLGPPFYPIILFGSTTLLTGMTGISMHMQWPLHNFSVAVLGKF
jgi:hypothetical protein